MPVGVAILGKHTRQSSDEAKKKWKDKKEYYLSYKKTHREKYLEYYRKYNRKRSNKLRRLKMRRAIRKDCPWFSHYIAAYGRCNLKCNPKYSSYSKKGIKFKLSINDIQKLWTRDKAWKLKIPMLHRIDNFGDYEYSNCKFLSCSEHSKLHHSERKKLNHG